MTKAGLLTAIVMIPALLAGCATEPEEEPSIDEVASEFIEKTLPGSGIFVSVYAPGGPDTLWSSAGPCNTFSEDHAVLERVLTEEELDWICCQSPEYEAYPEDVGYSSGVITIEAGRVGCRLFGHR